MNRFIDRLSRAISAYFNLTPYLVSQEEAEQSIRDGVTFRGTNIIILIIAIFIASLGLNTNSTAVIIGAMLISPLMGPIIGLGLGVGVQDYDLLRKSLKNLLMATLFSVATSTLYFLISPVGQSHSELLARTSPTIYDVLIGFFGGGAGIVAIGSRSKGNVIPGVAIATALMPPLCTVGYGLATWQPHYFLGALYLFLINSIFICVATFIGVKLMKYQPVHSNDPVRAKKVRRIVYIITTVTLLPSIYLTYNMIRQTRFQLNAERFVKEECVFPETQVLTSSTSWTSRGRQLTLTLIGQTLPKDSLVLALSSRLGEYGLSGTHINIVQGAAASAEKVSEAELMGSSLSDIYHISQAAIAAKQNTIDSLRSVVNMLSAANTEAASIMPELKVVFPQVADIAVASTTLAKADTTDVDTLHVALVKLRSPLGAARRRELARYLAARLRLPSVEIVDLPAR